MRGCFRMTAACENSPMLAVEDELRSRGYAVIAGTDEAGRGPLAGPVVAAAVIFPPGFIIRGVNDSKKLTAKQRERLFPLIQESSVCWAVAETDTETIDRINILQASLLAMSRAVNALTARPDAVIADGNFAPADIDPGIFVKCVPRGDALCHSVAAASILAKVYRDALMAKLHNEYPLYGFDKHKGYGTREHLRALSEYGPCPAHRKSFKPINQHNG